MKKKKKVQKIIMTCKSFCCEKKSEVYNCNPYNKALCSFICLLTAESNGLRKLIGTLEDDICKISFCFNSFFKIPRATLGISAYL